jgi:hypothetical protein
MHPYRPRNQVGTSELLARDLGERYNGGESFLPPEAHGFPENTNSRLSNRLQIHSVEAFGCMFVLLHLQPAERLSAWSCQFSVFCRWPCHG